MYSNEGRKNRNLSLLHSGVTAESPPHFLKALAYFPLPYLTSLGDKLLSGTLFLGQSVDSIR